MKDQMSSGSQRKYQLSHEEGNDAAYCTEATTETSSLLTQTKTDISVGDIDKQNGTYPIDHVLLNHDQDDKGAEGDKQTISNISASVHLLKASIGTGILAMPDAIKTLD